MRGGRRQEVEALDASKNKLGAERRERLGGTMSINY